MQEQASHGNLVTTAHLLQNNPYVIQVEKLTNLFTDLTPDKILFGSLSLVTRNQNDGWITQQSICKFITSLPETSLLTLSKNVKEYISEGKDCDCIQIISSILSNLERMFGESKNEYRKLIVFLGFPVHFSRRILKSTLRTEEEKQLVRLIGRVFYELSLGPREAKCLLGRERVLRGIIILIRTQNADSFLEALKTIKNLCQVSQNFEAFDNCNIVELLCDELRRKSETHNSSVKYWLIIRKHKFKF